MFYLDVIDKSTGHTVLSLPFVPVALVVVIALGLGIFLWRKKR